MCLKWLVLVVCYDSQLDFKSLEFSWILNVIGEFRKILWSFLNILVVAEAIKRACWPLNYMDYGALLLST